VLIHHFAIFLAITLYGKVLELIQLSDERPCRRHLRIQDMCRVNMPTYRHLVTSVPVSVSADRYEGIASICAKGPDGINSVSDKRPDR
jgi:hypothetical protein